MRQSAPWTGEPIRRLRDAAGFMQRDLAQLLQVHVKTVAAAEREAKLLPSRCEPWLWVLEQAAAAYEPVRIEALEVAVARAEDEARDMVEPPRRFAYLKVICSCRWATVAACSRWSSTRWTWKRSARAPTSGSAASGCSWQPIGSGWRQ